MEQQPAPSSLSVGRQSQPSCWDLTRNRVLLVEDSEDFQNLVKETLKGSCQEISCASSRREAMEHLQKESYDLVLLDLQLPDGDGFGLCSELLRRNKTQGIPIIFLSGSTSTSDKVKAFSIGADDFIVKPFIISEFRAKVQAKLRNLERYRGAKLTWECGLRIDPFRQKASIVEADRERDLQLTPAEFKILYFLSQHEGQAFTGKELLSTIWGDQVHVVEHSLYTHIYALRKKLGPLSSYIRSIPKGGYFFDAR